MSEQPSHIAREARALQQGLKEALKTREPWDKEVEFQRRNLRRQYLRLLLVHPFAKESRDAETHLWMQTSYAFISVYKQDITALDRVLQARQHPARQGGHGPVEYRKLIQRFRQFLAEEDKFWTQVVAHLHRSFSLHEAQSALVALGLNSTSKNTLEVSDPQKGSVSNAGRNHFQFPPEDSSASTAPQTPADRESCLAIFSKALVCLGDIARYRELYNESGGRPKAGLEEGLLAGRLDARSKRESNRLISRARNYERAQQCYDHARLLVPCEGNPSHQLAILASYQKDVFGSVYHYYRALCVRQPYDTASENLGTVLSKALDLWKKRTAKANENGQEEPVVPHAPRLRVDALKESVVVLNALWRLGVEKMDSTSPKQAERVRRDFESLVSSRVLPIELIWKTVVLGHGALWKHRMIRDAGKNKKSEASPGPSAAIEFRILVHIFGLHIALLKIGLVELAESPPEDAVEGDLAQRITAVFRRTLPALRISSKWLRANFKYVLNSRQAAGNDWDTLWATYSQFSDTLSLVFPVDRLPSTNTPFDEDIELQGFLPLGKMVMGEEKQPAAGGENANGSVKAPTPGQVHPNEEQLMRIADLLHDARALMALEESPIFHRDPASTRAVAELTPEPSLKSYGGRNVDVDEDAMTETTSKTDDDPVRDAFRKALNGSDIDINEEEEGEEEQIVWNPKASFPPVGSIAPSTLPSPQQQLSKQKSPDRASFSPSGSLNLTPSLSKGPLTPTHKKDQSSLSAAMPSTTTTAQDLLNNVMGLPGVTNGDSTRRHQQSVPQPRLLFGPGPSSLPGNSIWSTSLDGGTSKMQEPANQTSQTPHQYPTSPLTWSPTHSGPNFMNSHPMAPFPTQPQPIGVGSHHRSASSQVSVPQVFASPPRSSAHDPFTYPAPQPPIQRPGGHHGHSQSLYSVPPTLPGPQTGVNFPHPPQEYRHHIPNHPTLFAPPISQIWGTG